MDALAASYAISSLIIFGAVIALAVWLRRRTRVGYGIFFAGALVFVVSQVVHIPLNMALAPLLPGPRLLPVTAAMLGLSAGVCEEVARWLAVRFVLKRVRHGEEALMLGAGHGGIEAFFVGALGVLMVINVVVLDRQGAGALDGLTPELRTQAMAGIEQLRHTPALVPLLGALERLLVMPFHLAATMMVVKAVARNAPRWLLSAILFHALLDGVAVQLVATAGPVAAEIWIGAVAVASLAILLVLGRRLRRPPREEVRATPRGAPIELVETRKTYGGAVRALRGASLAIEEGSRTCLLGPNGAGKTTTIRLLTGGIAPSGGHAFLFGTESGDDGFLAAKRRLGLVPQQPGMYDDLEVGEWLALVRDLYGGGDVAAVAKELALEELLDRPMGKLSGGQKRRVAIAAAVLGEPDLLILDEPSAGLDPVASREVLDYLDRLAPSRTILLCTHDLEEAEELCDRVVVMRDGKVLVHEAIQALRDRLAPQLALRVSSDDAAARDALAALGYEVVDGEDGALLVHVADPRADAPALLRGLLDRGVDVVECRVVRPTLEQLFLDIVGRSAGAPDDAEGAPDEGAGAVEPLPPPIPLGDLFASTTRRLLAKEWRQLRKSGSAFWTSLLLPVFFLLLAPQSLIAAVLGDERGAAPLEDPVPDFGIFGEIGEDPTRVVLAIFPLFVTIAALAAPTALITHSIVNERETRTLELLVALPVRIQQVIAAKLACAFIFTAAVCGACVLVVGGELVALGLADAVDALALVALLLAVLAHATASALLVAVVAKDFRTANNLAGVVIVPAIFVVMGVTVLVQGGAARAFVLALLFATAALAVGRGALRSATFEKLLS